LVCGAVGQGGDGGKESVGGKRRRDEAGRVDVDERTVLPEVADALREAAVGTATRGGEVEIRAAEHCVAIRSFRAILTPPVSMFKIFGCLRQTYE
jgi:hypothetical protein